MLQNRNWSQRNNNDSLEGIKTLTIKMNSNKFFAEFVCIHTSLCLGIKIRISFRSFCCQFTNPFICVRVYVFIFRYNYNAAAWYANFVHYFCFFNCIKCRLYKKIWTYIEKYTQLLVYNWRNSQCFLIESRMFGAFRKLVAVLKIENCYVTLITEISLISIE